MPLQRAMIAADKQDDMARYARYAADDVKRASAMPARAIARVAAILRKIYIQDTAKKMMRRDALMRDMSRAPLRYDSARRRRRRLISPPRCRRDCYDFRVCAMRASAMPRVMLPRQRAICRYYAMSAIIAYAPR